MKIVVSGASGLVGTALARRWSGTHTVVGLGRQRTAGGIQCDPTTDTLDPSELSGADAVVHLAGAGIADRRWSDSVKRDIRDSRVQGTSLIARSMAAAETPPPVLVCASAIGFYGDRDDAVLDEESDPGEGFLSEVSLEWEAAADPAREAGLRVAHLRIGIVLSRHGGALKQMLLPFQLGVGGKLGSGDQYMSWIGLEDLTRIIEYAIEQPAIQGAVNAVAPTPVTNAEFTRTLGRVLRRPTIFPVPGFGVRLLFGEMGDALLLGSTRVVPTRLSATSFTFEHADLDSALRAALA